MLSLNRKICDDLWPGMYGKDPKTHRVVTTHMEDALPVVRHVYTDAGVLSAGTSDGVCSTKLNILFNAPI